MRLVHDIVALNAPESPSTASTTERVVCASLAWRIQGTERLLSRESIWWTERSQDPTHPFYVGISTNPDVWVFSRAFSRLDAMLQKRTSSHSGATINSRVGRF